jgi:hypothetical protein
MDGPRNGFSFDLAVGDKSKNKSPEQLCVSLAFLLGWLDSF